MADSSTATITNSEEGSGGVISPSRWRSLPSPWAQVVRRGGVEDSGAPRSPSSSPSPLVSEQNNVVSDQLKVIEPEPEPAAESQPEVPDDSNNSNAGGKKKSAWNNPSANGVVEGATTPVMGAASWPALSESTRSIPKSLSSSDSSSNLTSAASVAISQAPVISQPPQKPAKTYTNSHSNANHTHRRSMKRGGGAGGAGAGYSRPLPPPPPPMPPAFPLFDMSYGNFIPPLLDSTAREQQPPYNANGWAPRSRNGIGSHSSNRNPPRRNNFGPHPRGDGGLFLNNGYGGRQDHQDREWHGPRSHAARDAHIPHQMVPPPPPLPRAFMRQPNPGPAPYIVPPPFRPYMGYEMGAPFVYVPTLPPEPYRSPPLLPHAPPPPSMFIPVMDPPLNVLILNQIEYYFSDANLVKDNFLRSNMDEEGWVPIALIAGFPRVQSLTTDVQMILNSLRDSSVVEVQGDKLRRRNEWSRWIHSSSQSPMEEISMGKLTLEETTTNENNISDKKENGIGQKGTNDSSNLANGEVSTESTRA